MKNILLILCTGILFSCNQKKEDSSRDMLYITDTTDLNRAYADTAVLQPVAPVAVAASPRRATTSRRSTTRTGSSTSNSNNTGSGSTSTAGTGTTTPTKKEGWSKAAKGAVIGGVGGAVAGAVITKSGKGAVIGGVIGAGGGYIIGRSKDKKDGRVGN